MKKPVTRFGVDEYADTSTVEAQHVAFRVSEIDEHTTIEEALSGDHSQQWKMAADAEYKSQMENKTWELVKLPEGVSGLVLACVQQYLV